MKPDAIEVRWLKTNPQDASSVAHGSEPAPSMTVLHWTASTRAPKGVVHALPERSTINPETHSGLLEAIAKARLWIDDLVKGRAQSLAEIAHREGKVERHIRLLAPLAFVSPPVILAVLDGVAPPFKLNVTSVAAALPHLWTEQMRRFARTG